MLSKHCLRRVVHLYLALHSGITSCDSRARDFEHDQVNIIIIIISMCVMLSSRLTSMSMVNKLECWSTLVYEALCHVISANTLRVGTVYVINTQRSQHLQGNRTIITIHH